MVSVQEVAEAMAASDVTDAERDVLERLWAAGPTAVRALAALLSTQARPVIAPTVLKLLERLENKGFVVRDRQRNPHLFRAAVSRDELIQRRLQALAGDLCGGSMVPLVSCLVERGQLTEDDRAAIRRMIDEMGDGPESQAS